MRDLALIMGGYAGPIGPEVRVAIRVWRRLYAQALLTENWAAANLVGRAIAATAPWNRRAA
jgi:hypothetical protein